VSPMTDSKVYNLDTRQTFFNNIRLLIIFMIMFTHYNLNLGSYEVMYIHMNVDKLDNLVGTTKMFQHLSPSRTC
jgi:hypothetical protein